MTEEKKFIIDLNASAEYLTDDQLTTLKLLSNLIYRNIQLNLRQICQLITLINNSKLVALAPLMNNLEIFIKREIISKEDNIEMDFVSNNIAICYLVTVELKTMSKVNYKQNLSASLDLQARLNDLILADEVKECLTAVWKEYKAKSESTLLTNITNAIKSASTAALENKDLIIGLITTLKLVVDNVKPLLINYAPNEESKTAKPKKSITKE
jgi:hypothetical protein